MSRRSEIAGNLYGLDPNTCHTTDVTPEQQRELEQKLNRIVDFCKERKLPVDNYFEHEHFITSTGCTGVFHIISLFQVAPRYTQRLSVITKATIICHGDFRKAFFLPIQTDDRGFPSQCVWNFVRSKRYKDGDDYRPAPYVVCQTLIKECLVRMAKSKKVLKGYKRTLARLYDLIAPEQSEESFPTMPLPSPAPSVEDLWLLVNRPEYFKWGVPSELKECFGEEPGSSRITREKLTRALSHIAKNRFCRERLCGMLEFQSLWHMLDKDPKTASWLLWELRAMRSCEGNKARAIEAIKHSAILHMLINKYFELGIENASAPSFQNSEGEFGYGLTNYSIVMGDVITRGTLPPHVIVDASVAEAPSSDLSNETTDACMLVDEMANFDISQISKALKRKKSGCAICGKKCFEDGGTLKECDKCKSVVYCSRKHQKMHWKNGHKKECVLPGLKRRFDYRNS